VYSAPYVQAHVYGESLLNTDSLLWPSLLLFSDTYLPSHQEALRDPKWRQAMEVAYPMGKVITQSQQPSSIRERWGGMTHRVVKVITQSQSPT
jgi:hypothetical protein